MKQLSPTDSVFVFNESSRTPQHISGLMIYDPPEAGAEPVRFTDILKRFDERMYKTPVFRRKLSKVALDLDRPYWIEDEDFDLEFHVRHMALPKPGDWRQFCILLARLQSRPIDLTRPPWEVYVIEGLDNINGLPSGSFAMLTKTHHAAIDGSTGSQMVEALHDLVPNPEPEPIKDTWLPEAEPSQMAKLSRAYLKLFKSPKQLQAIVKHALKSRSDSTKQISGGVEGHEISEGIRFTEGVSPHRVFGGLRMQLDDVKGIKNSVDKATLNDVLLSIVGGAMRHYLNEHNELPEKTLVVAVPISTRMAEDVDTEGGNAVSGMRLNLRTDIENPLERLVAINNDAVGTKAYANAIGAERLTTVLNSIPSGIASLGMRTMSATGLASRNPFAHTIVTNVPGPQFPLYFCGAKVSLWMGLGCLSDGMGLFHTVNSYNGYISLSFLCCREMMPDPEFYHQCINRSLEEHMSAVQALSAEKPKSKPKSKTKVTAKAANL